MDADTLRRQVMKPWCPKCVYEWQGAGEDGCQCGCQLCPPLWARCAELKPWGFVVLSGGFFIHRHGIDLEHAEALIGWKCIGWISATNDYWVEMGNALKAYDQLAALIALCHRILDQREALGG